MQWRTSAFKKTIRLMIPKMVGHPVELMTFWAFTALASSLAVGSISALNFARNFQSVPVSLIGITMSTAAFPLLADAIAGGRARDYVQTLRRILGSIFVISALAAVVLYVIREPLVTLLLGGGLFDPEAAARTTGVLGVFCLAIPTESISHLLARAFYARQNTLVPVVFSILALVIAVGAGWAFLPVIGIMALPAGFFAGSLVKSAGLAGWMWKQMRSVSR
jgi:putative peptidoglycan lipid II flippase